MFGQMLDKFEQTIWPPNMIARVAIFGLLVAPCCGVAIGMLIAACQFIVVRDPDHFVMDLFFGVLFGGFLGLTFGVLLAIPVSFLRLDEVLLVLGGGAIVIGVPLALIPNEDGAGLTYGALGAIVGYWTGAATLLISALVKGVRKNAEDSE